MREDRSLLADAFEETIRWEPPVTVILRRATRDTELGGVPVEEGADVGLLLGSANRDERKYEHPDRFDLFRASRQSVGFGFGVHVCLGMHLARMETRVAINTLFDRLPDMRLDAGARTRTCTSRAWPSVRPSPSRSPSPRPEVAGGAAAARVGRADAPAPC